MRSEARVAAAVETLDAVLEGASAERTLTNWGRRNRFAGAGDRAAIRDLVFDALRQRRSLAWQGGADTGRGLMIGLARATGKNPAEIFNGLQYAPSQLTAVESIVPQPLDEAPGPVRFDCPDWLWPVLRQSLGDSTEPVLGLLRTRAPVFLRVNRARTDRETVAGLLAEDGIRTIAHPLSSTALEVLENARRIRSSSAYLDGLVELQDAASQAVADTVLPYSQGRRVLDYCAGGGGKALALAAGGAGEVVAHDALPDRMRDIPERARRAGVAILRTDHPDGRFEAVLCDAPCSGSGAWRRQPEAKWRLTPEALAKLTAVQDSILDEACRFVAPGGVLAYATCSLFGVENRDRVTAFLERHPNWQQITQVALTPIDGGDGFFCALLRQREESI